MSDPHTIADVITAIPAVLNAIFAALTTILTGLAAVFGAATAVVLSGRKLAQAVRRRRRPRP